MLEHKELIEACVDGDMKAQRRFYELFAGRMFVICLRYAKSDLEAEDVLQESFIKIFRNIEKFRGESRLEYWMKRIVINTALNHHRNKLYMYPMVNVETVQHEFQHNQTISNYQFEELLKMIQELPTGCKMIFNLYAIEGYSHKEIAEMLEISEGTSKSQLSRAKMLLQKKITDDQSGKYGKFRKQE